MPRRAATSWKEAIENLLSHPHVHESTGTVLGGYPHTTGDLPEGQDSVAARERSMLYKPTV